MNKFTFAALAAVAALVLGFGSHLSTTTTHAAATGSSAVPCEFLGAAIDGNPDDVTLGEYLDACNGVSEAEAGLLADALGDEDGTLEASDLEDLAAYGGNQVEDNGGDTRYGTLVLFAFVDNDGAVTFDADAGVVIEGGDTRGDFTADANVEICGDGDDLDCDTTATSDGDGVVTAFVVDASADAGDSVDVTISQEDSSDDSTQTINVVGAPHDITLTSLQDVIQESDDFGDCTDDLDITDAADQLGDADKTVVVAVVTDANDNKLTRAAVTFESDEPDIAENDEDGSGELGSLPKSFTTESVDAGAAGIGSFSLYCGGDTGTATITATVTTNRTAWMLDQEEEEPTLDKATDDDSVDLTVVGAPDAIALTAAPAQIACDGTQTATVTAKVTDANGDNVADGNTVNFSVVALGTANPINAKTVAGEASSTITPLSGSTAGVTVIVTAGEAQSSIRVDCSLPIPTPTSAAPAPTATPKGGTIGVSDTGNGGYMGQDGSASFPMWTLIALAMGSVALVGGSVVARRSGK